MIRKAMLALLLGTLVIGLSACGERPTKIYKQGKYQGKQDTQPWDNEQFKGDRTAWENAEKARAQNENDYTKVN